MFKEKMKQAKEMVIQSSEGNNKKKIENLVVFLIILIVTIVAINMIWSGDKKKENSNGNNEVDLGKQLASTKQIESEDSLEKISTSSDLEQKLKNILMKIEGVGKVEVIITYSETSEVIPMYNENMKESSTEEEDTNGGKRNIKQLDSDREIIYQEINGEKIPITQKIVLPKIQGAIVTAEGASDSQVKTNIIQAVEAVTGLATHKIQVFVMQS